MKAAVEKEIRTMSDSIEIRSENNEPAKIIGYAARFNSPSEEMWGFVEQIRPGAFLKALEKSDARALFNHDPNLILGREKSGTLKLSEDEVGLRYEITPPDTQWAKDLISSIQRGDVSQSSFAFSMTGGVEEWDDSKEPAVRTIVEVGKLYDISPVTYPAYPSTSVNVRSMEEVAQEHRKRSADKRPNVEVLKRRLEIEAEI